MAATLPRELIKWIQSLDLTWSLKNAKWDLSNGYLIAEIFSWYYPQDVEMYMFHNCSSLKLKFANWQSLKKFMKKRNIPIPLEYADAVMHCKEGAAELFIQALYELLTNRQLKVIPADPEIDFTDSAYQSQLPDHARSTAVQALRNNLKATEMQVYVDITSKRALSQAILNRHTENRALTRLSDPERYGHKPTIGELAPRRPPPLENCTSDDSMEQEACCTPGCDGNGYQDDENNMCSQHPDYSATVHFNENEYHPVHVDS